MTARAYVEQLRAGIAALPAEDAPRITAWCDWADRWLDSNDPTTNVTLVMGLEDQADD